MQGAQGVQNHLCASTRRQFNSVQLNVCWEVNEKYHFLLHLKQKMWGDEI